jgi:ATP-dependent helicase/DNAse subunit B
MNNIPGHRSYSQLSQFARCQRQYYLAKIAQVPEKPAVYLVAGNAIHTILERINWAHVSMQDGGQDEG